MISGTVDAYSNIKFYNQNNPISKNKIDKKFDKILAIQQSVGWNKNDASIACRRLKDDFDIKIFKKIDKKTIAYAIINPRLENIGTVWYLSQIAVDQSEHRRGHGANMMHFIFEKAKEANVNYVDLDVNPTEKHLLKFYRSIQNEKATLENDSYGELRYKIS